MKLQYTIATYIQCDRKNLIFMNHLIPCKSMAKLTKVVIVVLSHLRDIQNESSNVSCMYGLINIIEQTNIRL